MTSDIQIGSYRVKPVSVKWRTGVGVIMETCTIVLPRVKFAQNQLTSTDDASEKSKPLFNIGDKVVVKLGYQGKNRTRFEGFVRTISITRQYEIECEGYTYQLPKSFSKSYASVTLKKLLQDITEGTDIYLSTYIPQLTIPNVRFKEASGVQVLEFLNKECLLAVYFEGKELYAGFEQGKKKGKVILSLEWNTADEKDFKKITRKNDVRYVISYKDSEGKNVQTKPIHEKYSQIKKVKVKPGLDKEYIAKQQMYLQQKQDYTGYEGTILCFLEPYMEPSNVVEVRDSRYQERKGMFFVRTVDGSFDSGGGRQKVELGYFGVVDK